MANNILITPASASIQFSGSYALHGGQIKLQVLSSGSLSFQGTGSGQLFGIENSLTGSLMAVTDASGIPILEVFSDATVEASNLKAYTPIKTKSVDFVLQLLDKGTYNRCHGQITCSISESATIPFALGTEIEFVQTSSLGNMFFLTGSSVTLNSKNANRRLAGQWSAATLKKIDTDEWDLIGDLT